LNQLPWEFAKDQFGAQGADFCYKVLQSVGNSFAPLRCNNDIVETTKDSRIFHTAGWRGR